MTRLHLEIAHILRLHGSDYRQRHPVSPEQSQVMQRLVQCRTAALGGHVEQCRSCSYVRIAYNSCRDRHCPKSLSENLFSPAYQVPIFRVSPSCVVCSRIGSKNLSEN